MTDNMKLTSLGKYKFKQPLSITSHWEREEWDDGFHNILVLENEELALIGSGLGEKDALENLEGHLDGLVYACLFIEEREFSEKSKEIKESLKGYLDIDDYEDEV